jgi:hypothetical protein
VLLAGPRSSPQQSMSSLSSSSMMMRSHRCHGRCRRRSATATAAFCHRQRPFWVRVYLSWSQILKRQLVLLLLIDDSPPRDLDPPGFRNAAAAAHVAGPTTRSRDGDVSHSVHVPSCQKACDFRHESSIVVRDDPLSSMHTALISRKNRPTLLAGFSNNNNHNLSLCERPVPSSVCCRAAR